MVLENSSLFLDLNQALSRLAELMFPCEQSDVLMVGLCQEAMPGANKIARELGLNFAFSNAVINAETTARFDKVNPVDFDYARVEESGRDIPQDFIVHQERNLRNNLISIYEKTYQRITNKYPNKVVVMVDQLTNINAAFFSCLTRKYIGQACGNGGSIPAIRKFIFLHASKGSSASACTQDFDMLIEHSFN